MFFGHPLRSSNLFLPTPGAISSILASVLHERR
jgi:hypothetical protein